MDLVIEERLSLMGVKGRAWVGFTAPEPLHVAGGGGLACVCVPAWEFAASAADGDDGGMRGMGLVRTNGGMVWGAL